MLRSATLVWLFFLSTYSAFAQCGGEERWAVKDGTDPAASEVDLNNIEATTIAKLVHIHQPHIPSDNTTRVVPDETHVVRLKARLMQWKLETDDDYHLVLTDDTERFTPGHGRPTGHGVIGEIPSPECLPGSHEEFGTQSPLLLVGNGSQLGIANARRQLEQEFPDADLSGGWNDAGGVDVEVVGVEFFDRAHGQVGRAPNNLELHPVLSINFAQHPQELLAAAPGADARATSSSTAGPHRGALSHGQPLLIQDPDSGEIATVTPERALRVATSETSGKSGRLKPGIGSPDLGFPKALTVCWFPANTPGTIQISVDGSSWFDAESTSASSCRAVPAARFVKLTSNAGMYQVSY